MRRGVLAVSAVVILALSAAAILRFGEGQFIALSAAESATDRQMEKAWYSNEKLGLSFLYDQGQKVEYYGPRKQNPNKIAKVLVAQDSNDPKREVFWTIDVWKYNVAEYRIVYDIFPGLIFSSKKEIDLGGIKATELSYQGMSQISGTKHVYRIYVIRQNNKTYVISGKYCNDDKDKACEEFLATFKIG